MCHIHEKIRQFAVELRQEERAPGTVENYLRHAHAFAAWLRGRPITPELCNQWKSHLLETGYAPATVNSMVAAVNRFIAFLGWKEYKIKSLKLQRKLFRDDMPSYKARAETVRHAEVFMGCYTISRCPGENIDSPTVVGAQAANELLNIVGVKASFVLTEFHNRIYISARAIDEVNVQIIMERLGGGGHLNIAGAQLDGVTMEEAIQKVKDVLTKMTEEGAI